MSLHRQVRALLREADQDPSTPPDFKAWNHFLSRLGDVFASLDTERFRLERSLQFHHSEVQALYQELLTYREQLNVVAALVAEPFILLDSQGAALVVSPLATGLLGYSELDDEADSLLEHMGVAGLLGTSEVGHLLCDGVPLQARGMVQKRDGSRLEANLQIHPLIRENHLVGALVIVRDSSEPASLGQLQQMRSQSSLLLSFPLLPEVEKCARIILNQTERALSLVRADRDENTVEEMAAVSQLQQADAKGLRARDPGL